MGLDKPSIIAMSGLSIHSISENISKRKSKQSNSRQQGSNWQDEAAKDTKAQSNHMQSNQCQLAEALAQSYDQKQ
jgi:hypothetical protein